LVLYLVAGEVFIGGTAGEFFVVRWWVLTGLSKFCSYRTTTMLAACIGYVHSATRRIRGRYKACSGFLHGLDEVSNDVSGVASRYVRGRYKVC